MIYYRWGICAVLLVSVMLLSSCRHVGSNDFSPNTVPVANPGVDQSVTLPATVTLDGSASSDADGDSLTYAWTLTSVPSGSTAVLSDATEVNPTFTPEIPGVYVAQLIVFDGTDMSSAATVSIAASGTIANLITNGSFEDGLTGWTAAMHFEAGATGTGSYNADTAPGIETLTALEGFPATDGTHIALGSVASTTAGGSITSSTLYQDVEIPAQASTAIITFDIGVKGNINGFNNGYKIGIFSTASAPGYTASALAGSTVFASVASADTTLQSRASLSFDISAGAGQTVRFAIINACQDNRGEVIGIDNVKLSVFVTY